MGEFPLGQSSPKRAWQDTEYFRQSAKSFWGVEVVGATVFGVVGAFGGFLLTTKDTPSFWQFAYPTIGGAIGIISGFVITFFLIYAWYLFRAPYKQRNEAREKVEWLLEERRTQQQEMPYIKIVDTYEDNVGECGLIFSNSGSTNLVNCHANLLDIDWETPSKQFTLARFPKVEDLICDNIVAGFSNGKIPLFRWKGMMDDKKLEIVYQKKSERIVCDIPILVLLNVWADNKQATYAVCKLEDRLGWGYGLSILKTGVQQHKLDLVTFQKVNLDK